jgi:hypothetical protein
MGLMLLEILVFLLAHWLARSTIDLACEFFRQIIRQNTLVCKIDLHALKAQIKCRLNVINDNALGHIPQQLGTVQFIIRTRRLENLILLFEGKVGVRKAGVNVLFEQVQHLIVRNDTRIGKVVDTGQPLLGHGQRRRQHFSQNGHGVWNVDNLFVLCNLGDKVSMRQIIRNRHSHSQNHTVRIFLEQRFHVSLGLTVKGSIKVGSILFGESNARTECVCVIVLENTARGVDGAMNVALATQVRDVEGSNDIGANGFGLVVFAPINVGATRNAGRHEHMRGLDTI